MKNFARPIPEVDLQARQEGEAADQVSHNVQRNAVCYVTIAWSFTVSLVLNAFASRSRPQWKELWPPLQRAKHFEKSLDWIDLSDWLGLLAKILCADLDLRNC